jgi:hypothetical protein
MVEAEEVRRGGVNGIEGRTTVGFEARRVDKEGAGRGGAGTRGGVGVGREMTFVVES